MSDNQEEYWDSVSSGKEFTTPLQIEEFKKYVKNDMKILDAGCGYGRTLNELYINGFTYLTGVDFSLGMINRGLKMYPHLKLTKNTKSVLPFPDNSFNAVLILAVLTCIVEDENQNKMMMEIQRVLKDDGIIYINDYLLNQDQRNIERYDLFKDKYNNYGTFLLPEGAVVRHHTKEHVFQLVNNFDKIIYKELIYTTMNGNKSNGFYYIGKKKN